MNSKLELYKPLVTLPTIEVTREDINHDLDDDAKRLLSKSHADATVKAYLSDARVFSAWCVSRNISAIDATTADIMNFIAKQTSGKESRWVWTDKPNRIGYLSDGKPLAYSTIYRRLNGVKFALKNLGREFNETEINYLNSIMKGVAADIGTEKRKVKGIGPNELTLIFSKLNTEDLIDLRDRALLMTLFAGAFRRSELAALLVKNVSFIPNKGVDIKMDKVKRKVNGMTKSIVKGANLCPVRFLKDYMEAANVVDGFVFCRANRNREILKTPLNAAVINRIVKKRCAQAGLEGLYGGHSGRRGFVDTAISQGKPINKVMEMTGHASVQTVQEYFDHHERWKDNAGEGLY